jgi:hypothetical protein
MEENHPESPRPAMPTQVLLELISKTNFNNSGDGLRMAVNSGAPQESQYSGKPVLARLTQYEEDLEKTKACKADVDSKKMKEVDFIATLL